jgi:putative nucleotidyltransferase with HDIG domain
MAPRLEFVVQQVNSLPTLPTILHRITELVNNPRTSCLQVARVILDDQATTARLLRLVNSPFYGFPRRIATVTEAVTILGFHAVRNLVMTTAVVDLFGGQESAEFSPARLWEHSIGTAVAASLLARSIHHEEREELFVAGLLHDVGKLVLYQFLPREFLKALARAREEDASLREMEHQVLGYTHDQVGRVLLDRWKLPLRLTEAVVYHHRPDLAQVAKREAAVVHVADVLARASGLHPDGDDAVPALIPEAWMRLKLSESILDGLMAELEEQYWNTREILLAPLLEGGEACNGARNAA